MSCGAVGLTYNGRVAANSDMHFESATVSDWYITNVKPIKIARLGCLPRDGTAVNRKVCIEIHFYVSTVGRSSSLVAVLDGIGVGETAPEKRGGQVNG